MNYILFSAAVQNHLDKLDNNRRCERKRGDEAELFSCERGNAEQSREGRNQKHQREQQNSEHERAQACRV